MFLSPGDEVTWVLRVLFAAIAGAAIGLERELTAHPAGMRTHLLVAAGSAAFTILSMHGFSDVLGEPHVVLDPSRVAAQIVAGIGFIGGGAILKYGASVRGLTTAGSLWATAAVGFAFGSGLLLLGTATAALIVFSLWPLHAVLERVHRYRQSDLRVRLSMSRLDTLGSVYEFLLDEHVEIATVSNRRIDQDRFEVTMTLRVPFGLRAADVQVRLASISGVAQVSRVGDEDV